MSILDHYLESHQEMKLGHQFHLKARVLSVEHTNEKIESGLFRPHYYDHEVITNLIFFNFFTAVEGKIQKKN